MYTLSDYRRAGMFFLVIALVSLLLTSCGHWECASDGMAGYTDARVHVVKGPVRKSY